MKYVFHLRMTWLQCKFSKFVKGDKTISDITAYTQIQVNIFCITVRLGGINNYVDCSSSSRTRGN